MRTLESHEGRTVAAVEKSRVDYRRVLSVVLRLARGRSDRIAVAHTDWEAAFRVAERERLAALCWHHGRLVIEQCAPPAVTQAWRAHAISNAAQAETRLATLASLLQIFREVGVEPVVLKGLPLAQRLYGDMTLRASGDTDLYIPAAQRRVAEEGLERAGWIGSYGRGSREAAFRRREGGEVAVLELHSSLADDNLLEHLRLPEPQWREVVTGGVATRALDGAMVPISIAMHLAKRFAPPLLWVVDLLTEWERLDQRTRAQVRELAATCHLARCFADGLFRTYAVDAAAAGDRAAVARLWYTASGRRDRHNALRIARLSDTAADAVRVTFAWAWPHELRREPALYARTVAARLGRVLTRRRPVLFVPRTPATEPPRAALAVSGTLHEPVRELLSFGVPVWIRATGSSMRPTIAPGTRVRLVDTRCRQVRRGDVVLARLPSGRTVLHRVARVETAHVILRGDNTTGSDAPVSRSAVIGIADLMEAAGRIIAVPRRRRPTWRALAGDARRVAAAVARLMESGA